MMLSLHRAIAICMCCLCLCACTQHHVLAALTAAQKAQLESDLAGLGRLLNLSIADGKSRFSTSPPVTSCSGFDVACNPNNTPVPYIDFSTGTVPAAYDKVQIKQLSTQDYRQRMADVCAFNSMKDVWKRNLNQAAGSSINKITYQYATLTDSLFGVYPMSDWEPCSDFIAFSRPWAVSGATGKKDIVILIDASDPPFSEGGGGDGFSDGTARLALAKKIANQIIGGLSYKDHVAVVAYGDAADGRVTTLRRGSLAEQAILKSEVSNISLMARNKTNVGAALQAALNIFATSETLGLSSKCTQAIVLLTSGNNDASYPLPGIVMDTKKNVVVFPLLVVQPGGAITAAKQKFVNSLACATQGLTRTFASTSDLINTTALTDWFSALATENEIRASEIYTDALGQGRVLSLSAPLYVPDRISGVSKLKAVIALDVKFASLSQSGAISESDVNNFNSAQQSCRFLDQHSAHQSRIIARLQNESGMTCADDLDKLGFGLAAGEQLPIVKAMPGIVVAVLVVVIGVGAYGCWLYTKMPQSTTTTTTPYKTSGGDAECNRMIVLAALISYAVFFVIAISVCFSLVFSDLVAFHHFVPVDFSVTATSCSPYRCCELESCSCVEADLEAEPCSTLLRDLKEDNCKNGYACCQESCSDCACTTDADGFTSCSRCCSCDYSVSEQTCRTVCGSCYSCSTTGQYVYRSILHQAQFPRTCSLRGAEDCRAAFLSEFTVGTTRTVFVNPEQANDVRLSVELREPPLIAFIIMTVFGGISAVVMFIFACQ